MSIVKELATFLHLYLHASGTPASDSASMDDLLKAAKLPSEEELGRMKPKHVKKIARALNALYNTWVQLNLERKKLTLWSTTDPEYHRIQTVIDRLEEIIRQSTEEKLEKYVHRVPALKPIPSNYTDINLPKRLESTAPDNNANVETKDAEEEATTQDDSENENSDSSDDSDDEDGSTSAPAAVTQAPASVTQTKARNVTRPAALQGTSRRRSTNRLETQADVSVEVHSVDVGSELAAISAELAAVNTLDLKPIQTLAAIKPAELKKLVRNIKDTSTVTKAIDRTSICTYKKIFELITESTKRKPSQYELQTIPGQKLQRLTKKDKPNHYCKGALIFKSDCDQSNIRVCKCTAASGNPCKLGYGVHVICGKHYDSLSVAYGLYEKDGKLDAWAKMAKNLGSNTAATDA